jgi:hypothetical protein
LQLGFRPSGTVAVFGDQITLGILEQCHVVLGELVRGSRSCCLGSHISRVGVNTTLVGEEWLLGFLIPVGLRFFFA